MLAILAIHTHRKLYGNTCCFMHAHLSVCTNCNLWILLLAEGSDSGRSWRRRWHSKQY